MNIAISNIAWDHKQDDQIKKILSKHKIKGIEVAPTKVWQNSFKILDKSLLKYKNFWLSEKINVVAVCSLLYGHPDLTVFKTESARVETLSFLEQMIKIGNRLGAKVLVFGAPQNRITNGLPKKEVLKISKSFFSSVGEIAKEYDMFFCIEPNPIQYKTDFINNTKEAVELIETVNHPNFRLHLDSGTLALNKEDYEAAVNLGGDYLKHFHISEDFLVEVGHGLVDHQRLAGVLRKIDYQGWISIEMPALNTDEDIQRVDRALSFVNKIYS